ncbi:gamma-glutamylcyclotransferase [Thermococcus chitonophagus]|uniref:Gamma-glutamylcyclotransferase n=1 Tax=Thermococcus chitonophagus TaxID=54262 RepID=A0A161K9L9_9EURY|nr:gamma-glutamylcyclotransferase [Thermococcus chitonophagus]ASJ16985.1 gamma-glutamylcyclotransferase [Thermococcus chitonophagus]CUX78468.1 hypothetical protein CHITON_1689 [Thermococcus chitonophagus]
MPLIAVYGSLRRRKCLHDHYMKSATFLGKDWIEGFELWVGEWPYAVKGEGRIKVEVYEVCEETFEEINKMEVESGYIPTKVKTKFGIAVLWEYPRRRGRKIESGDINDQ